MTNLELKGRILKMVVGIDDPEKLNLVHTWLEHFSIYFDDRKGNDKFWNDYHPFYQAELLQSIKESFEPENCIDHEIMKKKHAKWLNEE